MSGEQNHTYRLSAHALQQFLELPSLLRKQAAVAILTLGSEPVPPAARPYADIPDTYRLDEGSVAIFYRVVDDQIDVLVIRPNT